MDRAGLILVAALALTACAPRVPVPKEANHDGETPVRVPYPPPAAKAELIPPPPEAKEGGEKPVWVDGYWEWKGADYSWAAGRWVIPKPGRGYARPSLVRLSDGALMYYPPAWKRLPEDE